MTSRPKRTRLKICEDLFYRLRWNIFAILDEIEIVTGPYNSITIIPFISCQLANKSITNPPLSRIDEVCIAECWDRVDYRYGEEFRYKPPPSLTIYNKDGSPITLGQFVTEVHAYLNLHAEELKTAKALTYGRARPIDSTDRVPAYGEYYLPSNVRFFFWKAEGVRIGENFVRVSVQFFVEGERLTTVEQFWDKQLAFVQACEQQR